MNDKVIYPIGRILVIVMIAEIYQSIGVSWGNSAISNHGWYRSDSVGVSAYLFTKI